MLVEDMVKASEGTAPKKRPATPTKNSGARRNQSARSSNPPSPSSFDFTNLGPDVAAPDIDFVPSHSRAGEPAATTISSRDPRMRNRPQAKRDSSGIRPETVVSLSSSVRLNIIKRVLKWHYRWIEVIRLLHKVSFKSSDCKHAVIG